MYTLNPVALRAAIAQAGITREALARASDLSLAAVGKLVSGAVLSPNADTLLRICDVLGCEPRDLMRPALHIELTTTHAASSYGVPVALIDGHAYGPGDALADRVVADLVRAWAGEPIRTDAERALAAKFLSVPS